ncbi:alpha/beta fold hydrolase [Nocardia mangyaensis]|uniref:alpha/beta fold hydrolase n=1 Tax=Nocardia mangyaensis TaxID=2213200 RepID=UPI002676F581|nr:alpha/beta hydrolase [Nocardia mangyaensis]MDO3650155.1 alpha/beta hydrolase [Nocardia mangyaensis]
MGRAGIEKNLAVSEGVLGAGMPYLAFGSGRPLVFLRWFTPDHANPTGWLRSAEIKTMAPLAAHYRVYAVNRAPGMAEGTTMADIATAHAEGLAAEFDGPVDVLGISSGGSLALQLAADHPAAVRRLVVASSGHRLEEAARISQMKYATAAAQGKRALHHLATQGIESPVKARLVGAATWILDPFLRPKNPADTLAFVRAEDAFDLSGRLGDITAPTLVVGGDRDEYYRVSTFEQTAEGIPGARLIVYPDTNHLGAIKHPRFAPDVTEFLDAP